MLLPSALGFSPHPPVSVYGTGTINLIAAFLGTRLTSFVTLFTPLHAFDSDDGFSYRPLIRLHHSSFRGIRFPNASLHFSLIAVQEFKPVIHRIRLATSP